MIRKFLAVAGIAAIGLLAAPGAAQAYTPPPEPTIELSVDPSTIGIGEQVRVFMDDWLPGSTSQFSVSSPGVDGDDIGLVVLGSTSVAAKVSAEGSYTVGVTFPQGGVYTLAASGFDRDGNPKTVSMTLTIQGAGTGGGGNGGGTGGGLPFTGSNTFTGLLLGAGLAGVGGAVLLMSRKRVHSSTSIDA